MTTFYYIFEFLSFREIIVILKALKLIYCSSSSFIK
ncbi:MAG: hypothetical protein ACQZ3N_04095 [cyanobacterium endosymbiont of Rhopalodia yunnanensis]